MDVHSPEGEVMKRRNLGRDKGLTARMLLTGHGLYSDDLRQGW